MTAEVPANPCHAGSLGFCHGSRMVLQSSPGWPGRGSAGLAGTRRWGGGRLCVRGGGMHAVGSRRDPGHQPCCCSPRPRPWSKARPAFSCCGGSCHTLLLILESLEHVAHLLPCPRGPLLADPSWRPLLSWLVLSLPRCPLGVVQREEAHGVCQPPAPHRRFPAPSRCALRPAPGGEGPPRGSLCSAPTPLLTALSSRRSGLWTSTGTMLLPR